MPTDAESAGGNRLTRHRPTFLFSVDLEDVRSRMPDGKAYRDRVPEMTERYIGFLARHDARATFFAEGETARRHPDLVRLLVQAGHEVACHGDLHATIGDLGPRGFREDLERNLDALGQAGVQHVAGFRAPQFSLTSATAWAYDILGGLGFRYSSSVLPGRNPIHGWPGFGVGPRRAGTVVELPVSVLPGPMPALPFAGGVYLRVLPWPLVRYGCAAHRRRGAPVLGYVHPYDVDADQERFMLPGIDDSRVYNLLMYRNRRGLLEKLGRVMALGFQIARYQDYVESISAAELQPLRASSL
jgi:polysaccharide deacetylase family protein (PEP-CTERM system associated)